VTSVGGQRYGPKMPVSPSQVAAGTPSAPSETTEDSPPVAAPSIAPRTVELGMLAILALFASLVGILGVAYSIYAFKFLDHHVIFLLPSRIFFVLSLGLAVVPFLLVIFTNRIPYLFLVIPTALCFLLYPLLEPYGVLYGQDAIFNFQFASTFLVHLVWVAGANTTGEAITYSYYPASGLFNAEGSVFLGVPLTSSFPWILPTLRLLVLPPLIYAVGTRLLGSRAGILGVFFYMAVPSITFNDIVQQEFAVPFFALALAAITFLLYVPSEDATPVRILVLVFSSFVILSHHVTSYILGVWLAGLAILPLLLWGRPAYTALRAAVVSIRYFVLFLLFVFFFTATVVLSQLTILEKNILLLLGNAPLSAKAAAAGNTYPTYQLVWIIASLGIITIFAGLTLRATLRGKVRPYLGASLLMATILLLTGFALFPTGYSYDAIRLAEYALLFAAPAAAWFLLRILGPAIDRRIRPLEATPVGPRRSRRHLWVAPAIAIVIALFVFTGGNLVPGVSRDQFQPPKLLMVNSPMHLTAADFQDGMWARSHLNASGRVWGDLLVFDVYAGVGGLAMPYDTYDVFNGTGLQCTAVTGGGTPCATLASATKTLFRLSVGDYIVTDIYDTQLTPGFYGAGTDQPAGPLQESQLTKFNNPSYFSVVFVDSVFTVYQVINVHYTGL